MASRSIILAPWQVRAALEGRLSEVWVPMKGKHHQGRDGLHLVGPYLSDISGQLWTPAGRAIRCPLGVPGDLLWWAGTLHGEFVVNYRADGEFPPHMREERWRSPMHMPRLASRLTFRVLETGAQRVQAIGEEGAKESGVESALALWPNMSLEQCLTSGERVAAAPHRAAFAIQWDERWGDRQPRLWSANPRSWWARVEVIK